MAFGLLLWVSWLCFFLLDGSAALPTIKGYGYPDTSDSRNIGDDAEDEVLTSATSKQSNWQASNNQPTGFIYTSYNKPTVVQQSDWVPPQKNLPNKPSGLDMERLLNGVSPDWGQENLDKPLLFPLNYMPRDPAQLQPSPVQPLEAATTNSMTASPSAGGSVLSVGSATYYTPSFTSQAAKSPSSANWQPEPVSSGYGVVDFNTDSNAASGNIRHLIYEDVFQYPSENEPRQSYGTVSNTLGGYSQANHISRGSSTGYAPILEEPSFPSYPANVGAQPVFATGVGRFPGGVNHNFVQTADQLHDLILSEPQKMVNTQTVEVSQRVSDPILPPLPPPSYIAQSRNGYQRSRYLLSKSRYSPVFPPPIAISSKGVKGPAPSQPAVPKDAKKPQ